MPEDVRVVNSAQKINDEQGDYVCIKAVIDSAEMFVPLDANNKERMLIQAWEDAGNAIADAD
jgi:hypothetical protein|tara:strand:+ start:1544 stop:1729 length:186 start_codon:yes stop_codon:yes gene_type:complete